PTTETLPRKDAVPISLRQPLRRASAVPDRRQLRRDVRRARDAGAKSRGLRGPAAGPAAGVARRRGPGRAGARRLRAGPALAPRRSEEHTSELQSREKL